MTTQHKTTTADVGPTAMALDTDWMRRSGQLETFAGTDHMLLIALTQMSYSVKQSLFLACTAAPACSAVSRMSKGWY